MQAVNPMEKRGAEYKQESAKTDGMSKGPASQGAGGNDGNIFASLKRGGKEIAQESAKTDGVCK
jgi:hypothetical protein